MENVVEKKYNIGGFNVEYDVSSEGELHAILSKKFTILGRTKSVVVAIHSDQKFYKDLSGNNPLGLDQFAKSIISSVVDDVTESIKRLDRYLIDELRTYLDNSLLSTAYIDSLIQSKEELYISYETDASSAFHPEVKDLGSLIKINLADLIGEDSDVLFHELLHMISSMIRQSNRWNLKSEDPMVNDALKSNVFIEDIRPDKSNLELLSGTLDKSDGVVKHLLPNDVFIPGDSSSYETKVYWLAEYILTRNYMETEKVMELYKQFDYSFGITDVNKFLFKDLEEALGWISVHSRISVDYINSFEKCAHVLKEDHVALSIRQIKNAFREVGLSFSKEKIRNLLFHPRMHLSSGSDALWENSDIVRIYLSTSSNPNDADTMAKNILKFKDLALNDTGSDSKLSRATLSPLARLGNYLESKGFIKEAGYLSLIIK